MSGKIEKFLRISLEKFLSKLTLKRFGKGICCQNRVGNLIKRDCWELSHITGLTGLREPNTLIQVFLLEGGIYTI